MVMLFVRDRKMPMAIIMARAMFVTSLVLLNYMCW
jgi:hypothetical protein